MKELIRSNIAMEQFSNGVLLTTHPFPPTLGRERNIFMAEPGNGEIPVNKPLGGNLSPEIKKPIPPQPFRKPTEEMARKAWGFINEGRAVDRGELETQEMAIKMRILPVGGGVGQPPEEGRRRPQDISQEEARRRLDAAARGEEGRPQAGAAGGEGGRGEPPRTATGAPEEPEPEPEGDPLIDVTDPALGQFRDRAINMISGMRGGQFNETAFNNLRRQIEDATPPEGYTQEQRDEFLHQRQLIFGALAGALPRESRSDAEARRFNRRVSELVSIIEEREVDDPKVYAAIDEIFEGEDSSARDYGEFVKYTVLELTNQETIEISTKNSHIVEYMLERAAERILQRADEDQTAAYPQPSFYEGINLDDIISISRVYDHSIGRKPGDKRSAFRYLLSLKERRHVMHELYRSMKNLQAYHGLVTDSLRSEGLAFVEKGIAGVPEAKMLYEKFTGSELGLREGWLRKDDHGDIDVNIEDFLAFYGDSHHFKKAITDSEGNSIGSRDLRPWELKRAAIVGKSLFAAMQRRAVYTVSGDTPDDPAIRFDSPGDEVLGKRLAPFKILGERFIADTNTRKIYLEDLEVETIRLAEINGQRFGYGAKNKDGNRNGLYGKKEASWALLDTGVKDPQSNSWRGDNFFLREERHRTEENGTLTLGEYLYNTKKEERGKFEAEIRKKYPRKNPRQIDSVLDSPMYEARWGDNFNRRVSEVVRRQRLGLGVLIAIGGLGSYSVRDAQGKVVKVNNKEVIWENVADLLPSRIAAIFPNEMKAIAQGVYGQLDAAPSEELILPPAVGEPLSGELISPPVSSGPVSAIERWKTLRNKLFLAEIKRVTDDAQTVEGKAWEKVDQTKLKKLSDYYAECGITDEKDIQLIEQITALGKRMAPELAMIKHPFTPFLDDVPKTDWEKVDDFTFDRLIAGDHNDTDKGWGAVLGILSQPIKEPKAIVAAFKEAKDNMQLAMGLERATGAQAYLEPHVNALLGMARESELAKIFGPIMKLGRVPRSKMEEGNLQAGIAFNEDFTSSVLQGLAQGDVISDDPAKEDRNGLTQFSRMKKENKADMKWKLYYWARMILLIFGPIAGAEFIKVMLPREAAETVLAGL